MRLVLAAGGGITATFLLFLLMHMLISGEQGFTGAMESGGIVDFIRVREEEIIRVKKRALPEEPPPPDRPPPPPQIQLADQAAEPSPVALDMGIPTIAVPVTTGNGPNIGPYIGRWSPGDPAAEGDVIPIVRIDPEWPRQALIEGTDGWVEVEFTILPDGSVEDPVVTASEPPRLFDRNALRAILRWKFKPRIIEGEAVSRRAAQRIDFVMDPEAP
jgi:protein TonB